MTEMLPSKAIIVMRYSSPSELRHTYAASLELAESTGQTVLVIAEDVDLESLDEDEMRMHGWIRDRR